MSGYFEDPYLGGDGDVAYRVSNRVGPHEFDPVGRLFHRDLCRYCYESRWAHPGAWVAARPWGDKSKRLTVKIGKGECWG